MIYGYMKLLENNDTIITYLNIESREDPRLQFECLESVSFRDKSMAIEGSDKHIERSERP